jgi:GNAT superfamily N-acetyltransferase
LIAGLPLEALGVEPFHFGAVERSSPLVIDHIGIVWAARTNSALTKWTGRGSWLRAFVHMRAWERHIADSSHMEMTVGPLRDGEWPAALALLHRAFVDEPFTREMYGEDRLERWTGSWALYEPLRHDGYSVRLAARAGQLVVGVLLGSRPGDCHVCDVLALGPRPADPTDAIDWEFQKNVAAAHAPVGPHGWVSKVAVEPALQGLGVGRLLLDALPEAVAGDATVLLECQPHRQAFYASAGFEPVTHFPDPAGPDALLMRRRQPAQVDSAGAPVR